MNNNLDYDLDAVMEEWREENKYRDEADRDHIPEDKDNRTIKNVIKAMEESNQINAIDKITALIEDAVINRP